MTMIFRIVGIAAIVLGLFWIGQSMGLIASPVLGFMAGQRRWALWGLLLAGLGLVLLLRAARHRRR